jgi:hypothetical protein
VPTSDMTAGLMIAQVRAELVLLGGDVEGGLAAFDRCLETARGWGFFDISTTGLEPWTLISLATDLAAHARFADAPARLARGAELAVETAALLSRFATVPDVAVDYPVTGMALAALGQWMLCHEERPDVETAISLLALADGFGYNRWFPVMAWEPMAALADDVAPGRLAAVLEEYDDHRGRGLRSEAERVLGSLRLTSSG